MPRRYRPEKRTQAPDLRYNSKTVAMFIARLMESGKKSTATRILYDSFDMIQDRMDKPALEVFEQALRNVMPAVEVAPPRWWCNLSGTN